MARIGIRHENKSRFEARSPLTPEAVGSLVAEHGVEVTVQTSPIRAFPADQYEAAGATIAADLAECPLIMGVKEIPTELMEPEKAYLYFSHTIKGQSENMPALKQLMELGCTLIDYEKITDEKGRRLVFFGRFAGIAGMIDTFWILGRRLKSRGIDNPFERIQPAHTYRDLDHVRDEIRSLGEDIRAGGLPEEIQPFVCGFAGYGQVSQGAQEIFDLLPVKEVQPEDLPDVQATADACYKVVFYEEHMVKRIDPAKPFELQEYYRQPELYEADFFRHVQHLTLMVNCIYWEPRYPVMITRDQFRDLYGGPAGPRLEVIGDITCDIDGSIACTTRATEPGNPVYVYDPATGVTRDGVEGPGPAVLAVELLPCEVPVDASIAFSEALMPFVPALAKADFSQPLNQSGLPAELQRATILWRGALTEPYQYLRQYLA